MSDRIVLRGLVFEGRHGYGDEERANPQPVEVDVALSLDLRPAATSDDLERSVDYSAVTRQIGRVIESTSFRLIESIAEAIAEELLAAHAVVDEVEVRVHKPRIRLGQGAGTAAVEIRRRRAGAG
jgi:FolB domain-containing protein